MSSDSRCLAVITAFSHLECNGARAPLDRCLTDHVLTLHRRLVGLRLSPLIPISARRTAMVSVPDGLTERGRIPSVLKVGSCNGLERAMVSSV
jgi:hypothetical protein